MAFGRSLELYFIDGRPEGMLTAQVFNWTGHVLKTPRTQIRAALERPEARYTGVYLLIGERDGRPLVYIGEGEDIATRIRDHEAKRDWWGDAILITTSADALHKAHAKYLEARLVEQARDVGAVDLDNANTPLGSSLSEAATANMEEFLDTLFIVLPALGLTFFSSPKRPTEDKTSTETMAYPRFKLVTRKNGIEATAFLRGSEFIMEKGSKIRAKWEGAGPHDAGYRKLHAELVASGAMDISSSPAELSENVAFSSPSAAAAVANGRPANGRLEWKSFADGKSFGEWELAQLDELDLGHSQGRGP